MWLIRWWKGFHDSVGDHIALDFLIKFVHLSIAFILWVFHDKMNSISSVQYEFKMKIYFVLSKLRGWWFVNLWSQKHSKFIIFQYQTEIKDLWIHQPRDFPVMLVLGWVVRIGFEVVLHLKLIDWFTIWLVNLVNHTNQHRFAMFDRYPNVLGRRHLKHDFMNKKRFHNARLGVEICNIIQ